MCYDLAASNWAHRGPKKIFLQGEITLRAIRDLPLCYAAFDVVRIIPGWSSRRVKLFSNGPDRAAPSADPPPLAKQRS